MSLMKSIAEQTGDDLVALRRWAPTIAQQLRHPVVVVQDNRTGRGGVVSSNCLSQYPALFAQTTVVAHYDATGKELAVPPPSPVAEKEVEQEPDPVAALWQMPWWRWVIGAVNLSVLVVAIARCSKGA